MPGHNPIFWKVFDRLLDTMAIVSGVLIVFQVVSVTANVIARYSYGYSIPGVTTWNEWSLLWVAFLGFAWLQRERGHVSMDLIKDTFSPRFRTVFDFVTCILAAAIASVLVWYGTKVTWQYWIEGRYDYFKLAEVPVAPFYAVIPFGSFVLLIQLLRDAVADIRALGTGARPGSSPQFPQEF